LREAGFSLASWTPPGPVSAAFVASRKPVNVIQGPIGSGKTTTCFFKALRYTAMMPPCRDGVIRAKGAVVRADYRTLYSTTLESWFKWFPRDQHSDFLGGQDRPAVHRVKFLTPRGRKIQLQVEFKALGAQRIEDIMRGWEGSWLYGNEVDTQDEATLDFGMQRTWRYPSFDLLDPEDAAFKAFPFMVDPEEPSKKSLPFCVILDLNAPPDPDHWVCKRIINHADTNTPNSNIAYFRQPGGLDADAENRDRSPRIVYLELAKTMDKYQVHRMIHNKIGYDRSGLPVFDEFDEDANIDDLAPDPGLPLHLGLDISGLHPAAVIAQQKSLQILLLDELYVGRVHPEVFAEHLASHLAEHYPGFRLGASYYDPSNDYGADKEGGYLASIDTIRLACFGRGEGPLLPAPSNEIPVRLAALRAPMLKNVRVAAGVTARGLVADRRRCKMFIKGCISHYRYRLTPQGGLVNPENPKPIKNEYANVVDAAEYVALGLQGVAGTIGEAAGGRTRGARRERAAGGGVIQQGNWGV
jgi:hypothetical protein